MLAGVLSIGVILLLVKHATAIHDEEKVIQHQMNLLESVGKCQKEFPISYEDIDSFKSKKFPKSEEAPCFTSCVFKSFDVFDEKGYLLYAGAPEKFKAMFHDEDKVKMLEDVLKACAKVNDEEVNNDCDRAKLAYTCFVEEAEKLHYNLDF